jgi:actin related protein 2/3 complex subunit 1A/1B
MWVHWVALERNYADYAQDCEAYRFHGGAQGWQLAGSVESKGRPGVSDGREESALNMFKQMDLKGKTKDDTKLSTVHQNTISTIRVYSEGGGAVSKFSCKFLLPSLVEVF